jgi:midasin
VLSDGRFNKDNVRKYLRESKEKRYLYIFVVLDKTATETQIKAGNNGSIMQMRSVQKVGGAIKLVPYLQDFPFDYYCVVKDTTQLPSALGTILVQWFSMVNGGGSSRK